MPGDRPPRVAGHLSRHAEQIQAAKVSRNSRKRPALGVVSAAEANDSGRVQAGAKSRKQMAAHDATSSSTATNSRRPTAAKPTVAGSSTSVDRDGLNRREKLRLWQEAQRKKQSKGSASSTRKATPKPIMSGTSSSGKRSRDRAAQLPTRRTVPASGTPDATVATSPSEALDGATGPTSTSATGAQQTTPVPSLPADGHIAVPPADQTLLLAGGRLQVSRMAPGARSEPPVSRTAGERRNESLPASRLEQRQPDISRAMEPEQERDQGQDQDQDQDGIDSLLGCTEDLDDFVAQSAPVQMPSVPGTEQEVNLMQQLYAMERKCASLQHRMQADSNEMEVMRRTMRRCLEENDRLHAESAQLGAVKKELMDKESERKQLEILYTESVHRLEQELKNARANAVASPSRSPTGAAASLDTSALLCTPTVSESVRRSTGSDLIFSPLRLAATPNAQAEIAELRAQLEAMHQEVAAKDAALQTTRAHFECDALVQETENQQLKEALEKQQDEMDRRLQEKNDEIRHLSEEFSELIERKQQDHTAAMQQYLGALRMAQQKMATYKAQYEQLKAAVNAPDDQQNSDPNMSGDDKSASARPSPSKRRRRAVEQSPSQHSSGSGSHEPKR